MDPAMRRHIAALDAALRRIALERHRGLVIVAERRKGEDFMTEQPSREEIEWAIQVWERSALSRKNTIHAVLFAARQYLASLDASAPLPIIDEMDPRHILNPGTGAHVLDHGSPKDGTRGPRYCTFCGAGEREYSECEDVRCDIQQIT